MVMIWETIVKRLLKLVSRLSWSNLLGMDPNQLAGVQHMLRMDHTGLRTP